MNFPSEQIQELKEVYPNVQKYEECGITYFLLPNIALPEGCVPERCDVLLCPTERDGYPSRLFFSTRVQSPKQLNWNGNSQIIERNWYAYSWKLHSREHSLKNLVGIHLRAL